MPRVVVQALGEALSTRMGRALRGAKVLIMGVAYKKNIDDLRESPALRIMEILQGFRRRGFLLRPVLPRDPE